MWIGNDGHEFTTEIRGVHFAGPDFDSLDPDRSTRPEELALFHFISPGMSLCDCIIECDVPLQIVDGKGTSDAILHVRVSLGKARLPERGGIEAETLHLRLATGSVDYESNGTSGCFETELLSLHERFPRGSHLACCFSCDFSDYHPVGQGLLGYMLCFRDARAVYIQVKTKKALFEALPLVTECVQEFHVCSEFKRRVPGHGYR
jgi:hypothetical protein